MTRDKKEYHILVIEDNPGDFAIVEDLLTDQIVKPVIRRAINYKAAFDIVIAGTAFDIILLDLSLPDKSGQDLISEILQVTSSCPIIILTGYDDINFSIRSIAQGIMDYLLKDDLNAVTLYKSILYAIERKRDVIEKVRILKELKEAKLVAEKSVRMKDEFISNMSHEIRTPLNAIIGFNDLLKQSHLNKEQDRLVEIVRVASQNLMVIINDILDLSKLESGMLSLEKRPINLKEIAENIITLQTQKAKEKGIKLLLSMDQDIPFHVTGDSTRISQILLNLISNAIKFTDQGFVELRIIELDRKENNSLLRFSVKDTGVGIDKENQEIIFERFSQAESSTTRLFGGTGLGLNISKMLVSMHGGKIDLQSELGSGSEFSFEISFLIPDSIDTGIGTKRKSSSSGIYLAGKLILVVDDNEHNQLLASLYLKKNGAEIVVAENGAIAIEKIKQNKYDLILMDVQMPVMDGFAATKIIRDELKLKIPIIACSAHSLLGERQNCLDKGMNEYISKPFSEEILINVLGSFFNEKQNSETPLTKMVKKSDVALDDFAKILANTGIEYGKEYVDMMLEVYRKRIPTDITELEIALEKKDFETIKEKAHLLAGSLSSLYFEEGSRIAKNTELTSIKGDFEETKYETALLINYLNISLETI